MDDYIKIENLNKTYGEKTAIDDLSLNLSSGKIYGLLGPNGSGKTTLIKTLAGLVKPNSGSITIGGDAPGYKTKSTTAYLSDGYFLFENLKVGDAIDMYADFFEDFDRDFAGRLIEYFHLPEKNLAHKLSKGDKEKLNIALTLSRNAKLFLLDEPLDGLDPISIAKLVDIIIDKIDGDATFIITTHQIESLENLFDEVIFLNQGSIHQRSSVDDIRNESQMEISEYYDEIYIG